jgi:hypothetical protein
MRIQIDTVKKTVQVLDNLKIKDLLKSLKELLGEEYKEYELLTTGYYYYWTTPWIYYPHLYPTYATGVLLSTDSVTPSYTDGDHSIYNVEVHG